MVGAALAVRAKGVAAANDLSHVEDERLLRRKELSSESMGEVEALLVSQKKQAAQTAQMRAAVGKMAGSVFIDEKNPW